MKKLLLLLLCPLFSSAQIVNIPDANFKALLVGATTSYSPATDDAGYPVVIDTNGDGEIEISEALLVHNLFVGSSEIHDLTGVEAFVNLQRLGFEQSQVSVFNSAPLVNLKELYCSQNQLTSLDLAPLTQLEILECGNNPDLGTLNVGSLTHLQMLKCPYDGLYALDVSNLANLSYLDCGQNSISSLNLANLVNLQKLYCGSNNISTLNVLSNTALLELDIANFNMAQIDISTLTDLQKFYAFNSNLASLDVSNNTALTNLSLTNTPLVTVDVSMLSALTELSVGGPNFTGTDITNLTNLTSLGIDHSTQVSLDVSHAPNLYNLSVSNTAITHLDLSNLPLLFGLNLVDNPDIVSLNIKNGHNNYNPYISNCPALQYICADEDYVSFFQNFFSLNTTDGTPEFGNSADGQASSYCTFTPGGIYNTLTGAVHFDADNNGCGGADAAMPSLRVAVSDGTSNGAVFTNGAGQYTQYIQLPNVTFTPTLSQPSWFSVFPASFTTDGAAIDGSIQAHDFCVSPNGSHPDLEVSVMPQLPAKPGFTASYHIMLHNKGNQSQSGTLAFQFDGSRLSFSSAIPAPNNTISGTLTWDYQDLIPFSTRDFTIWLNVNSFTDTPPVNLGDVLNITAMAAVPNDESPDDNSFSLNQTVVGSFDPNEIFCAEGEQLPTSFIGEPLHYIVNFENTGTAGAENVVAKIFIDPEKYDISTLQPMGSSHAVNTVVTGNKVEFIFENIGLAPNEYGYVAYSIKSRNTLVSGDSVSSAASIYFDFNAPVVTNTATTVFQNLGVPSQAVENGVNLYPNPATTSFAVRSAVPIDDIRIIDQQGRVLRDFSASANETTVPLDGLAQGYYLVAVRTANGTVTKKLIKS